jgi:hypothetical protein
MVGYRQSPSIGPSLQLRIRAVIPNAAGSLRIRRWLCTPAPIWLVAALAALILATPAWILSDDLRAFALLHDDFEYTASSRDWATTLNHLFEPHNTHVVPVFRFWTFVLVALAARLIDLPAIFAAAGYLTLVAAMLAMCCVVARETRQTAAGLSAMAILGISTVTHPSVTWFSAGQALWAGAAILVTIAIAQSWYEKRGSLRLVALALAALLAPAIWSGGLLAGPAAITYLGFRKPFGFRKPAVLLGGVTLGYVVLILISSQRQMGAAGAVWESGHDLWPRPVQALLHSAQALVEACVGGNLGLDAITAPGQAVALLFALAVLHAWTRGGFARINPLEASGATIAVGSCLLIYGFRGTQPYSSLRALGWYHTLPQVGAILFAAGWWTALSVPKPGRMSLGQAARVLSLVIVFCLIQVPRATRHLIDEAPAFAPNEAATFPNTRMRAARARYFKHEFHDRQLRALARLDRVNQILSDLGASPESLRDVFGRAFVPGISEKQPGADAFGLLTPRPRNANALPALASHTSELIELLRPEPEHIPVWLDPKDPLARALRDFSGQ